MTTRTIIITIMTMLLPHYYIGGIAALYAQSEAVDAETHVVFETADEKEYRTVQYALFKTEQKARAVMAQLEDAVVRQRGDNGAVQMEN